MSYNDGLEALTRLTDQLKNDMSRSSSAEYRAGMRAAIAAAEDLMDDYDPMGGAA